MGYWYKYLTFDRKIRIFFKQFGFKVTRSSLFSVTIFILARTPIPCSVKVCSDCDDIVPLKSLYIIGQLGKTVSKSVITFFESNYILKNQPLKIFQMQADFSNSF